jgi:ATP-dependent protease HslVU (ClpYQ) peptidase subunit
VGPDFSVTPIADDTLWAEGSGRELAIGAAHALQRMRAETQAREIVRAAIETAISWDTQCGGTAWLAEITEGMS